MSEGDNGVEVDARGVRADGLFASREAMDAHNGWKRVDCLACGGRIIRNRTPWLSVMGTRDGSYVLTFGREPNTAHATNPDQVPEQDVFDLGIVHHDCEREVRDKLRRGEIELPKVLIKGVVEIGDDVTDDIPDRLHLPAEPDRCPFCDVDTDITDEHLWPLWFSRMLQRLNVKIRIAGKPARRIELTVPVCSACNNRWMAVLEQDAKPLLQALFKIGHERRNSLVLEDRPQQQLAFWAIKTALLIDVVQGPITPRGFLHALAIQRRPPTRSVIWIGHCDITHACRFERKTVSVRPDGSPESIGVTFTIFNVMFQVFCHFNEGDYAIADARTHSDLGKALTRIWPLPGHEVTWPPALRIDDEQSWETVVASLGPHQLFAGTARTLTS